MKSIPRVGALVLVALLTAACGGPANPVDLGFKEVPTDVVLGTQTSAPVSRPSADGGGPRLIPLPPSVVALPPPPFEPARRPAPAPPQAPQCATADPLRAPAVEAPSSIAAPPKDAQYLYRNKGSFEVSGAQARRGAFPESSLRTVKVLGVSDDARTFDFNVAETLSDITTSTTYRVVKPIPNAVPPPGAASDAGLFILRIDSSRANGEKAEFSPAPALRLATFPLVRGAQVQSRGVDPTSATTMAFTSTVAGKARVDACGEPLDSFTLELTEGTVLSPDQDLEFAATYALGTQYGGLILRDTVAFTGTDGDAGVSRSNTATITRAP
jgi:hypothetical protein